MLYAVFHTDKGIMKAELYEKETPITVENFTKLIKQGFYDGLIFHRVIPNFMVQAGCPNGRGDGGPGYTIKCETKAEKQYHDRGVLSMAKTAAPNSGGSQFFICHNRANTQHLDGQHTVFGKVIQGIEVVDLIRQGDKIQKIEVVTE